ncbi:MAG: hypothetical protein IJR91_09035 [Ruminococcus sp.]|nr:hypothetical protein [Ruminococcus sp.]
MADIIAGQAGVKAVSVDAADAALTEKADVLFIGGALYAYGLDKKLTAYLSGIDGSKVGEAVVFSTSWLSKHAIDLIKKALAAKGIKVREEFLYLKSGQVDKRTAEIKAFADKNIK